MHAARGRAIRGPGLVLLNAEVDRSGHIGWRDVDSPVTSRPDLSGAGLRQALGVDDAAARVGSVPDPDEIELEFVTRADVPVLRHV